MNHPKPYRWADIVERLWQHQRRLIFAHLLAVITALLSTPLPLFMPLLVDEVLLNNPGFIVGFINNHFPQTWQHATGYILIVTLFTLILRSSVLVLQAWQASHFSHIAKNVIYTLRQELLQHLEKVSLREYETLGSGQISSLLTTDLNQIDQLLGQGLSRFIVAVLTVISIAAILLWMNWQLALFILCLNPVVIGITFYMGRKVKQLKAKENQAFALFQESLRETLGAIQQIRVYHREKHYFGKIEARNNAIRKHAQAWQWRHEISSRLSMGFFLIGFDLFRATSMIMVMLSDLSIGQMLAIFGYLWFMMGPIQDIFNLQYDLQAASASLERLNQITHLQQEPQYPAKIQAFPANKTGASIQLHQVSFAYQAQQPIFTNINCDIKAGEKVALIGCSGSGKTTLVNLLLGLYPPDKGQICYNQVPIEQLGYAQIREQISTVLQQSSLFNDSLRHNLCLGKQFNDKQLWQVLEQAQLSELIKDMPKQLDTIIGQQGIRLSGGQRQRLAIARLLLRDPKIVILDEATAALDKETEARVHQALQQFLQGRTTLIIAHHPQAIEQADRIVYLNQGRLLKQKI